MKSGKRKMENKKLEYQLSIINYPLKVCLLLVLSIFLVSCGEIQSPKTEPFISQTTPPTKQEIRWSNGKLPKTLDPARVSAAPESDIVRALYEGLTDVDPKTLEPIPALATKWTASKDYKVWTFQLRKDARWTNGEPIIAQDFIDSWKRLAELGDKVPQRNLLKNIVGMDSEDILPVFAEEPNEEVERQEAAKVLEQQLKAENNSNAEISSSANTETASKSNNNPKSEKKDKPKSKPHSKSKFGIEALSDFALRVTLINPDREFSVLVAHPIFRPIYGDGEEFEKDGLTTDVITNGAFKLAAIGKDGITLERSPVFWGKNEVKLEKVKFVPTENAEQALAAYRSGQVDVVTNANFAPLALKLLRTYDDLHEAKHSALNFYEFNEDIKPFDDARVRQSLTIAIERERLTEDEMDGITEPALSFLPFTEENVFKQDLEKAKNLLNEAGFPNGQNFPVIKLLINRNDLQKRIAHAVAKMWKKNLNIETEIIIKEKADFENSYQNGEFDIVRRGIVLPTNDETANMLAMFEDRQILLNPKDPDKDEVKTNETTVNDILNDKTAEAPINLAEPEKTAEPKQESIIPTIIHNPRPLILTENEALERLPAIPLYFPMSYSLVKPYIQGFEVNSLDAPSLKQVEINDNWQPADKKTISNPQNSK